jgi:hypothetical protein
MIQTVEAILGTDGSVHLLGEISIPRARRAFVTVLDEPPAASETALISEASLAVDWNRPEEDAAWSHLQPGK